MAPCWRSRESSGTTRAQRRTLYLDYEAYESMALIKLRELAAPMRERFPIDRLALVHRLGRLEIGETSVLVAVSSEHRGAAFDACRFGIDTLKRTVPIWKKEYFEGGAVWADGEMPPAPSNSGPVGIQALGAFVRLLFLRKPLHHLRVFGPSKRGSLSFCLALAWPVTDSASSNRPGHPAARRTSGDRFAST